MCCRLQPSNERVHDERYGQASSPLQDTERSLGVLLGLYASLQAKSTLPSSDELEHLHWLHSDFFAGGLQVACAAAPFVYNFIVHVVSA